MNATGGGMAGRSGRVLRVLIAADVHSRVDNILRLATWYQNSQGNANSNCFSFRPDFILLAGDLVNTNHELDNLKKSLLQQQTGRSSALRGLDMMSATAAATARQQAQEEVREFRSVLEAFAKICPRVFYLPGNHDPSGLFPGLKEDIAPLYQDDTRTSLYKQMEAVTGAINFHDRMVRLAPNLVMAGFGGSVSQTLRTDPSAVVHPGYPYSEPQLAGGVRNLFEHKTQLDAKPLIETETEDGSDPWRSSSSASDQVLLVTHCGPADVGTTDVNLTPAQPQGRLETGSYELRNLLCTSAFQNGATPSNSYSSSSSSQDDAANRILSALFPDSTPNSSYSSPPFTSNPHTTDESPSSSPSTTLGSFGPLLMHIHGHSHAAWGLSHLGSIPVVNPGAMRDGRFAIATIEYGIGRVEGSGGRSAILRPRWALSGVQFWGL
ncbi:hypothetical protein HK102_008485 [Quaeritorhiza haematococci]|nr:hypothetical protein HK102_008485 [Quaeritorhiza haematococci]